MMKKWAAGFLLLFPLLMTAQVTINVQLPPAGMIQKDQLWNLVVVNNGTDVLDVFLSVDIQDAETGQTVLSGSGRSLLLGRGVKTISIRDVQPVLYNYQASGFTGNFIPIGAYVARYRVYRNSESPQPLAEESVQLTISPLSPPLLTLPADRDTVLTVYPSFSWLPPAPAEMFSHLGYDIAVAEVLAGQSPAEALLYNTPVYTAHNLQTVYHAYPSGFARLAEGRQYAWQVTARNDMDYAAQTEVWTFIVRPADSVAATRTGTAYVLLKNSATASGINYLSDNGLFIKYYSFDKAHETVIRFYNAAGQPVSEVTQPIVYGDNFLRFGLDHRFRKGEVYSIQVTDQQKNLYTARFSIR